MVVEIVGGRELRCYARGSTALQSSNATESAKRRFVHEEGNIYLSIFTSVTEVVYLGTCTAECCIWRRISIVRQPQATTLYLRSHMCRDL